ncbi:MAG: glycosyltransferase family 39 protein [Deltaproteobacteria bacterium]
MARATAHGSNGMPSRTSLTRVIFAVAVAAIAVRFAAIALVPRALVWDGEIYAPLAERIAHGQGYVYAARAGAVPTPTAFYPVGYPALLAAMMLAVRSTGLAVAALNVAAAALAAACTAWLGHRIAGARGALVAGLAYALAPGPAIWSATAMTETVTGALVVAALALAVSFRDGDSSRRRLAQCIAVGLALGAGTLVRPQLVVLAPVLGALAHAPRRGRWTSAAIALAAAMLVVAPWTARNCAVMHRCVFVSTNGGPNLLLGTLEDARGGFRHLHVADGCSDARSEPTRDDCMRHLAMRRIAENPLRTARLAAWKLWWTFGQEWAAASYLRDATRGRFDLARATLLARACSAWWWALLLLGSIGAARVLRDAPRNARAIVLGAVAVIAVFAVTHALFLGDDRYHLPLVPLVAAMAAGAFRRREAQ